MSLSRAHLTNPGSAAGSIARAPLVKNRAVPCPDCGAGVGEPCRSGSGETKTNPCAARKRMARRALNAGPAYDAADVLYARELTTAKRKAIRRAAGIPAADLGALIGTTREVIWAWDHAGTNGGPVGAAGAAYGRWLREHAHLIVRTR